MTIVIVREVRDEDEKKEEIYPLIEQKRFGNIIDAYREGTKRFCGSLPSRYVFHVLYIKIIVNTSC